MTPEQMRESASRERYWRYIEAWTSETEIPMSFVEFRASDEKR